MIRGDRFTLPSGQVVTRTYTHQPGDPGAAAVEYVIEGTDATINSVDVLYLAEIVRHEPWKPHLAVTGGTIPGSGGRAPTEKIAQNELSPPDLCKGGGAYDLRHAFEECDEDDLCNVCRGLWSDPIHGDDLRPTTPTGGSAPGPAGGGEPPDLTKGGGTERFLSALLRDAADFLSLTSGATGPVIGGLVDDMRGRANALDNLEHSYRRHAEKWTPDAKAIAGEMLRAIGQGGK